MAHGVPPGTGPVEPFPQVVDKAALWGTALVSLRLMENGREDGNGLRAFLCFAGE